MIEDKIIAHLPVIPYASPQSNRNRSGLAAFVALLASVVALFGGFMIFCGLPIIPNLIEHNNSADFADNLGFLIIGSVCVYVGVRWFRAVLQIRSAG